MRLMFKKGHPYVDATLGRAIEIRDGSQNAAQKLESLTALSAELAEYVRRLDRMRDGAKAVNDRRMAKLLERQRDAFATGLEQIARIAAKLSESMPRGFGYAPRFEAYPKWLKAPDSPAQHR